jgi:tetratricopeptide (TPR) repeat protein
VLSEGLNRFEDHAEMHFTMALYYEQSGQFDLMVSHLRRTIELDANHAEALNFLGYSFAEKGTNLEEALKLVNKSLDLKPGNGYITDSLGWVYYKLGMHKKAIKVLEKAYSIVRDDPVILEHLGDAYYSANNEKKALKIWKLALEAKETSENRDRDMKERLKNKIKNLTKNTSN